MNFTEIYGENERNRLRETAHGWAHREGMEIKVPYAQGGEISEAWLVALPTDGGYILRLATSRFSALRIGRKPLSYRIARALLLGVKDLQERIEAASDMGPASTMKHMEEWGAEQWAKEIGRMARSGELYTLAASRNIPAKIPCAVA